MPQRRTNVSEPGDTGYSEFLRIFRSKVFPGSGGDSPPPAELDLVAILNEVAGAVSSAMEVEDVLRIIVDQAKQVTDTEKAVLVLTDQHHDTLDLDTLVVRGSRSVHAQKWWEPHLDLLGRRVFEHGVPVMDVYEDQDAIVVASPVLVRDEPVALLLAINGMDRPFLKRHIDFLRVLSAFAGSAIQNAQFAEQSRYMLLASERDRIAREMHDGVVQSLFSISLGLELCKKQAATDSSGLVRKLDELQEQLNRSMTELRRFIYDLRPMNLKELGLVGAVECWVREITQGRHVHGHVSVTGEPLRLSPSEEACLYRVTKEAVSNVIRHANAQSFEVAFTFGARVAAVGVADDGEGFDTQAVLLGSTRGLGLRSIQDRLIREGGVLVVDSSARGTRLSVELPVRG